MLRKIMKMVIRKILGTLKKRNIEYQLKEDMDIREEEMKGKVFRNYHPGHMIGFIETREASK